MRLLAIILLLSFSNLSRAEVTKTSPLDDTKSTLIINELIADLIGDSANVETVCADCVEHTPVLPGLTASFYYKGAKCTNFIKSDGSYGPWGKVIEKYILEEDNGAIFLRDDLEAVKPSNGVCSTWRNLSEKQRVHFWVWTMTSIAWAESKCLPNFHNPKGTDDMAMGLFQMNELLRNRYWRGPHCDVSDIVDPKNNINCAMDIMTEVIKGRKGDYKTNGKLYGVGHNTYWEQLRNHQDGSQIGYRIRQFPLCSR